MRIRSRFPLFVALLGLTISVVGYIFGLANLQAAQSAFLGPSDLYGPRLIDVIVAGWCFWIGSSIGSFLNVVAWRMPRGESVNGRSYCPRCQTRLKAWDNFPVFGWLALGGRCRQCRLPISKRYPIVELAVGLSITLVAIGELYQLSLPHLISQYARGPLWQPVVDRGVLITLLFHVYALTISWAFALVRIDQHRLPTRLLAWGLIPIIAAIIVLPPLMIVSWRTLSGDDTPILLGTSLRIDAAIRVLSALVAAAIIGRSLARGLCPRADLKLDPLGKPTARLVDVIMVIAVPALVLGWQSSIALVVVASLLTLAIRRWVLRQTDVLGCFSVAIAIALTIHLFVWWRLHQWALWPADNSNPLVVMVWATLVLVVPTWLRESPESTTSATQPSEDFDDEWDDDDENASSDDNLTEDTDPNQA